ncbi:MAG: YtxH domain-containing protein [Candidatus Gracilibacteria bacterium]|jgi:gas vesicle protein
MTDEQKKEEDGVIGKMDKLIVGAIIGGAIGSVVGLTLAPKEGKETRKNIASASRNFMDSHKDNIKTAKRLAKETAIGFLRLIRNSIKK